jgi:hypothetical protein
MPDRVKAAVCVAAAFADAPADMPDDDRSRIAAHLQPEEVAGLLFGLIQARAFSKVLMTLGLEPAPGTAEVRRVGGPAAWRNPGEG